MDAKKPPVQAPAHRKKPAAKPASITWLGSGELHRAIVSLPSHLCSNGDQFDERIVFFEVPRTATDAGLHLQELLKLAWCTDTTNWCEDGLIYNIESTWDRLREDPNNELHLLAVAWGCIAEPGAIGPEGILYAEASRIDLFVSPRVALRLQEHLDIIEALRQAEPARRRRAQAKAVAA